jgi:tetratricopeptide (TPR) repeat protein
MGRFIHIVFLIIIATISVLAQDLELANEYFQKEDFVKARFHYESALKKKSAPQDVYPNYPQTLLKLGDKVSADRFFKKILKSAPSNNTYKIDYLFFLNAINSKELEKTTDKTIKEALANPQDFPSYLYYISSKREYGLLEKFITAYRKAYTNTTAFYRELAEAKKIQGNSREMSEELLLGFLADSEPIDNLKNILQNYLTEPEELEHFKGLLLEISQSDPQNTMISELLLWLFVQQRDFSSAFIHAKALDKRLKTTGERQQEVADLALENKDFDPAIRIYESIIKDYPKTTTFYYARGKYISAKEQKIKSKFPVDKTELNGLVKDYKQLIAESVATGSTNAYKYEGDMAMLYGFYLGKLDSAIILMNKALKESMFDKKFQAQARLNLGDLYLLDNQPWESTLLYSQVESMEKDQLLGHEAKLKNAKLHYYQGEFELAEEQMDVLKLATSREISNDAIQLSVLIQDNTAEDSTGYALKRYSAVELLIFQNKWEEAKKELDDLYQEYRAKSLKDDILFLEAKIARQFGNYSEAIQKLDQLLQDHYNDILADDAAFQIAQLYDYQLKNREKAMEYYNKVITQFPASIHVIESRKKFREIRGDKVN